MSEATPEAAAAVEPSGDAQAQQMLADAVSAGQFLNRPQTPAAPEAPQPPASSPEGGQEPPDWEAEAAKWKSLARKHENQHLSALGLKSKAELDELRQIAQKHREAEDAQKTEIQRATERATTFEQQLAEMKATNARLLAAATHNIPPELIDLLGSGTDEEIGARAELLAERLKAPAPAPSAPSTQRPVEALTAGAAPASSTAAATPDQWIRTMAGRTP